MNLQILTWTKYTKIFKNKKIENKSKRTHQWNEHKFSPISSKYVYGMGVHIRGHLLSPETYWPMLLIFVHKSFVKSSILPLKEDELIFIPNDEAE